MSLNTSRREGAVGQSGRRRVSIRLAASYTPAPLTRPSPPQGGAGVLRAFLPAPTVILSDSEESQYKLLIRQMVINPSRRGGCSMLFLGFICDEQYYDELVAYGGFPPFGALRHHLRHGVKRVTGFSVAQGLPTNPVPLPPRCAVGLWMLSNVPT